MSSKQTLAGFPDENHIKNNDCALPDGRDIAVLLAAHELFKAAREVVLSRSGRTATAEIHDRSGRIAVLTVRERDWPRLRNFASKAAWPGCFIHERPEPFDAYAWALSQLDD